MGNYLCVRTPFPPGDHHQCLCLPCGNNVCCIRIYAGSFCCSKASACLCCWNSVTETDRLEKKLRDMYMKSLV